MELKDVQFTFDLDFKAANSESTFDKPVELENGDMLLEGWAANYDIDREDEAFEEGAFTNGLKKFLEGNAPLCYHHRISDVIGKVVAAEPIPGKGIKVRAIVDNQAESSPLRHIYEGIRKGRINQLSFGGIFKRRMTKSGPRIHDVDLLELSTTPVAIGRGTNFSVIAGKALTEGKTITEEIIPPKDEEKVEETTECEVCKQREEQERIAAEEAARKEQEEKEAEERQAAEAKEEAERLAKEAKDDIPEEVLEGLAKLFDKLEKLTKSKEEQAKPNLDEVSEHPTEEQ